MVFVTQKHNTPTNTQSLSCTATILQHLEWSRPLNEWSRSFTELSFKHSQLVDIDLTRSDISIENLMDTCLPDRLDCTEDMEELINKLWPALLKLQITKQLKKE